MDHQNDPCDNQCKWERTTALEQLVFHKYTAIHDRRCSSEPLNESLMG